MSKEIFEIITDKIKKHKYLLNISYGISSLLVCFSLQNSPQFRVQRALHNSPYFEKSNNNKSLNLKLINKFFKDGKEYLYFNDFEVIIDISLKTINFLIYGNGKINIFDILSALKQSQNSSEISDIYIGKK